MPNAGVFVANGGRVLTRASGLPTFACHTAASVTQDFQSTAESDGVSVPDRLCGPGWQGSAGL